jgi:SAM-dependent methyltransferase
VADPAFRRDLYRGTPAYYDRFRVPYPPGLIRDLADRTGADGTGRLLDLACGTGQLTFPLRGRFAEVLAVDQEPEMAAAVSQKAATAGAANVRALACSAEDLSVPPGSFDLVTMGNAFHRLPRDTVAAGAFEWLRPGGFLALAWGGSPWEGDAPWQHALAEVMDRWRARAAAAGRVPAGYERARRERPDLVILTGAGFDAAGRYEFTVDHDWTPEALAGHLLSTAVLSPAALGGRVTEFAADLRRELLAVQGGGRFRQTMRFAYDLARRPGRTGA